MTNSTHLNVGNDNNNIAFLFSCPGKEEEEMKKPVSGQTGKNLEILLKYLNRKNPTKFPYTDKYQYRITNTWDRVEYREKTNRTEAKTSEIKQDENLKRIRNELIGIETLILFGDKAQQIINLLDFDGSIIKTKHLSLQGLAGIKKDLYGNTLQKKAKGNTEKRIEVIASHILKSI